MESDGAGPRRPSTDRSRQLDCVVVRRKDARVLKRCLLTLVLVASVVTGFAATSSKGRGAASCGVERWSIKTLQDPAGRALNLSAYKTTTVSALRSQPVKRGPGGSRGAGVESTVFKLRARLVEAKLESDSDIHLVIRDLASNGTMIVEFPLVTCASSATAGAKTRMKNARSAFVAACGMPSDTSFEPLQGKATIRGVGFFDFLHGQSGVAPNGIELHPVLKLTNATC